MSRVFFLVVALLSSLLLLSACQQAAPPTNRVEETRSGPEAQNVDKAAIEAELMRIEKDWPRVIREKDAAAVRKVEADDGIFVYPDGSSGDKAQDVKDMETGALSADSWEVADLKVNVLDADSAVVTGRSIVKGGKYKLPDGKSLDISGEYRFVDTFHRRGGEWKLVAGAGVPIQKPAASASPAAATSPATKATPSTAKSPAAHASPASKATP